MWDSFINGKTQFLIWVIKDQVETGKRRKMEDNRDGAAKGKNRRKR